MDRPLGPRQPDKRYAAYEDIFGRPGASHHIPPSHQHYPYPDKRTSYSSQLSPPQHQQPYRHPYPQYPQHIPPSYTQSPHLGRAASALANPNSSRESLTPAGLTPAQAYQAQIFLENPAGLQPDWNRYHNAPGPSDRSSHNGAPIHPMDPPRLGVSLDHDDGRLGLDFVGHPGNGSSTQPSPQDTDEGSSELPWIRAESAGTRSQVTSYISLFNTATANSRPAYDQLRNKDPVSVTFLIAYLPLLYLSSRVILASVTPHPHVLLELVLLSHQPY